MTARTNCIDRAGQILILCIWIEKRLVDLIVLKEHPRLINKVNKSSQLVNLPSTFASERARYWRDDFSKIIDKYISLFKPNASWESNLIAICDLRNIIGHSHVSLYRDYLLYRPSGRSKSGRSKKINQLIKNHIANRQNKSKRAKPFIMMLNLSDNVKYRG